MLVTPVPRLRHPTAPVGSLAVADAERACAPSAAVSPLEEEERRFDGDGHADGHAARPARG